MEDRIVIIFDKLVIFSPWKSVKFCVVRIRITDSDVITAIESARFMSEAQNMHEKMGDACFFVHFWAISSHSKSLPGLLPQKCNTGIIRIRVSVNFESIRKIIEVLFLDFQEFNAGIFFERLGLFLDLSSGGRSEKGILEFVDEG